MKSENGTLPPPEVKTRTRTKQICAMCKGGWPTTFKLDGEQLFECRRHAPKPDADRPGQRSYWRMTKATEGCAEWVTR